MASLINHGDKPRLERSCVPSPQDWIAVAPSRPGLERIEARFAGHAFDPHRHDTYAIGYTLSGVQSFDYRGQARDSAAGHVMVLHPDEQHDGHAGSDSGFRYRMLYVEPQLIRQALGDDTGVLPFVPDPVSTDGQLADAVIPALDDVDAPVEDLQFDQIVSNLAHALAAADPSYPGRKMSPLHVHAVAEARAYLDAHAQEAVTSEDLEAVTMPSQHVERARADAAGGAQNADALARDGRRSHRRMRIRKSSTPSRWETLATRHRPGRARRRARAADGCCPWHPPRV